jgi:hypothetical protein
MLITLRLVTVLVRGMGGVPCHHQMQSVLGELAGTGRHCISEHQRERWEEPWHTSSVESLRGPRQRRPARA